MAERQKQQAIRRSRVNSVPSISGQQQQQQQQPASPRHHYHHLSHSAPAEPRAAPARPRARLRTALPAAPSPTKRASVLDKSSTFARLAATKTVASAGRCVDSPTVQHARTTSSQSTDNDSESPAKSLDPNTLKKTKAIFGTLSLFDGSPTYKQRRRRAASTSSSYAVSTRHPLERSATGTTVSGGPVRRLHLRTTSHPSGNSFAQPTSTVIPSRLAMAAAAAGFGNDEGKIETDSNPCAAAPTQQDVPVATSWTSAMEQRSTIVEPERTYTCTQPSCGQQFHRLEHLDQHLSVHAVEEPFLCSLCGRRFAQSESLSQHHEMQHGLLVQEKPFCHPLLTTPLDASSLSPSTSSSSSRSPTSLSVGEARLSSCECPPGNYLQGDSSRCSSLSPAQDFAASFTMDNLLPLPISPSASSGSGLMMPPAAFQPPGNTQYMEDDTTTSSAMSSPSSMFMYSTSIDSHQPSLFELPHPSYGPGLLGGDDTLYGGGISPNYSATLFAPFKPDLYQPAATSMNSALYHDSTIMMPSFGDTTGYGPMFDDPAQYTSCDTDVSMMLF